MPHDFLTSLHSSVIGAVTEQTSEKTKLPESPIRNPAADSSAAGDDRHRTVGVSMSPQLRERAAGRAKSLGLPFSRYVQWCIEAELDGSSLGDRFKI